MGRPRIHDIRKAINTIRYVIKSGCEQRLLPKEFPPWQDSLRLLFMPAAAKAINDKWQMTSGKQQEIHDALISQVREKVGKKPIPAVENYRQSILVKTT